MVISIQSAIPMFGKQPAMPTGLPGRPPGVPLAPNGKPSKLTPQMRQVLDHLKTELKRRSPNGEIQQKDALAAVTTLINLQKGRQFAETDYTRMMGGVLGPMNPFRNDPKWLAQRNQFLQQNPTAASGYAQGYQQAAYRPNPYATYSNPYAQAYGSGYGSGYNPYGYQQGWGQQPYATNAYYPGNIRYY